MNVCLACFHSAAYAPLAEITEPNKREYCARNGYDFRTCLANPASPLTISFQRIEFVLQVLNTSFYEWVWYTGADTLITNMATKLTELANAILGDVVVATDCNGLNNDSFLVRNSPLAKEFLGKVMNGANDARYTSDQDVMWALRNDLTQPWLYRIKIVSQRLLNAYDYKRHYANAGGHCAEAKDIYGNDGQWQPGDLLIHWPALPLEKRIELAKEMLPQVMR